MFRDRVQKMESDMDKLRSVDDDGAGNIRSFSKCFNCFNRYDRCRFCAVPGVAAKTHCQYNYGYSVRCVHYWDTNKIRIIL